MSKSSINKYDNKSQLETLINEDTLKSIDDVYEKMKPHDEFELMFKNNNKGGNISYEKYHTILSYLTKRSKHQKLKLTTETTLDIIYNIDDERLSSYRITISGNEHINKYMKILHNRHNHVVFNVLTSMYIENKESNMISIMKKIKTKENTVDVSEFDIRFRLSNELKVTSKELEQLSNLKNEERFRISYRLKERVTMVIHDDINVKDGHKLLIDLTKTKSTKLINKIDTGITSYELEVELNINNKPRAHFLSEMLKETDIITKILQQSNYVITTAQSKFILDEYAQIFGINIEKATSLEMRKPQSLEIQYLAGNLPNKYAPTDKADGDRYFLIIVEMKVYLISTTLNVKYTGINLGHNMEKWNGTVMDGELIFIPKKNRYIFMVFDCLFSGQKDVRPENNFMVRLSKADEIIKKCFIFKGQTGFVIKDYGDDFDTNKIIKFHDGQINEHMDALNNDIEHEKQHPLVRRKYFIPVYGGESHEVFSYANLLWNKYMYDSRVKCPYSLDGLMFHPLNQEYTSSAKESRQTEYKLKPPDMNTIDFYVQFETISGTQESVTVYDNSINEYAKDKPYKIVNLYVGQEAERYGKEMPVPFQNNAGENYVAHLFLDNGQVRDETGNIIQDKTVVEFYYKNDITIPENFRWVPMRTRYDKTENVSKFGKGYGNYISVANKVWRSIINPILMSDIEILANKSSYAAHMESIKNKIDHALIISTAKENSYFQISSNLGKPMKNFHFFLKDMLIWTHCGKSYNNFKPLSVLDLSFGRGGDIMKYYIPEIAYLVGVDNDLDALTSKSDSAESRYQTMKNKYAKFPKMTFIHADLSAPLTMTDQETMIPNMSEQNKTDFNKYFSEEPSKRKLFDRIVCNFAIHYFFKNETTWKNFKSHLSNYLKPGGYFICTTFDAQIFMKDMKDSDNMSFEYTDKKGDKKMIFDFVRKYSNVYDENIIIKTGVAFDMHNSMFSRDGTYITEYLVDKRFIEQELLESCDMELVDTDTFSNQFEKQREYFANTATHDEPSKKLLSGVASFYDQNDEINKACFNGMTKFNRYYVFRKKETSNSYKQNKSDKQNKSEKKNETGKANKLKPPKKQSGGDLPYKDIFDDSKFFIDADGVKSESSYSKRIHDVLQNDKIIPNSTGVDTFYKEMKLSVKEDNALTYADKQKISKNIKISHDVLVAKKLKKEVSESSASEFGLSDTKQEYKNIVALNGLNVFTINLDCNGMYDVTVANKRSTNKISKKDKSIILINDGDMYKPCYKIIGDGNIRGIYDNDDEIINILVKNASK